jgi:hypothetical protein
MMCIMIELIYVKNVFIILNQQVNAKDVYVL